MSVRLVLKMHQSLDGFVCSPSGDASWVHQHMDADVLNWETERLWDAGTHVMGRRLYEIMAAYWPRATESPAAPMNQITKVVFSKTLRQLDWGPARVIAGDLKDEIARLKAKSSKLILAHGGASFAQALAETALVDEYRLLVHPVTLGAGIPCITSPLNLRLTASRVFPSGVVALTYAPAGERAAEALYLPDDRS